MVFDEVYFFGYLFGCMIDVTAMTHLISPIEAETIY